jgi:hypothetical protein
MYSCFAMTHSAPTKQAFLCGGAQVKVDPLQTFVIHAETQTQDQGVHRISISNLYKASPRKVSQPQLVQPLSLGSSRSLPMGQTAPQL